MQRLTKQYNNEFMMSDELTEHISNNVYSDNAVEFLIDSLLEKLYEYETLAEHGRLITLPCAVGDTVYETDYSPVCELKVSHIGLFLRTEEEGYYNELEDFGKTVFLTREEAESALAERRQSK